MKRIALIMFVLMISGCAPKMSSKSFYIERQRDTVDRTSLTYDNRGIYDCYDAPKSDQIPAHSEEMHKCIDAALAGAPTVQEDSKWEVLLGDAEGCAMGRFHKKFSDTAIPGRLTSKQAGACINMRAALDKVAARL